MCDRPGDASDCGRMQSRSERDRALKAETQARTEADNARRSAAESEAVGTFLEDNLLAAARPAGQEGGLGPSVTIREAVVAAQPKIGEAFRDQPTVEAAVRRPWGRPIITWVIRP